jgi:RNA polymerase sigma-70 factor (ECF subfamily)
MLSSGCAENGREPLDGSNRIEHRVQPTDEQLMEAVTQGDLAALRPLVERHHGPLLGFLYRMVGGDHHLAEDLVQETFIRLIRQRTYAAGRPFKPWLYAIAANLARDHFRSRSAAAAVAGDLGLLDLADPAPGPESIAIASNSSGVLMSTLTRLPHEYRATILLRFFQDMSLADIAIATNVPLGTVKSRLSVGTRKLRELLSNLDTRPSQ